MSDSCLFSDSDSDSDSDATYCDEPHSDPDDCVIVETTFESQNDLNARINDERCISPSQFLEIDTFESKEIGFQEPTSKVDKESADSGINSNKEFESIYSTITEFELESSFDQILSELNLNILENQPATKTKEASVETIDFAESDEEATKTDGKSEVIAESNRRISILNPNLEVKPPFVFYTISEILTFTDKLPVNNAVKMVGMYTIASNLHCLEDSQEATVKVTLDFKLLNEFPNLNCNVEIFGSIDLTQNTLPTIRVKIWKYVQGNPTAYIDCLQKIKSFTPARFLEVVNSAKTNEMSNPHLMRIEPYVFYSIKEILNFTILHRPIKNHQKTVGYFSEQNMNEYYLLDVEELSLDPSAKLLLNIKLMDTPPPFNDCCECFGSLTFQYIGSDLTPVFNVEICRVLKSHVIPYIENLRKIKRYVPSCFLELTDWNSADVSSLSSDSSDSEDINDSVLNAKFDSIVQKES